MHGALLHLRRLRLIEDKILSNAARFSSESRNAPRFFRGVFVRLFLRKGTFKKEKGELIKKKSGE